MSICGKEQIERCRSIWQRHANVTKMEEHLARPGRKDPDYVPISADLIGLKVIAAAEEIPPVGKYVALISRYRMTKTSSVAQGGLCAHNTDADVDGSHIRTLLLTFFFRHMEKLIMDGRLYIAQPPLYRIQVGKQRHYVFSDMEKDEFLARLGEGKNPSRQSLQRLGRDGPRGTMGYDHEFCNRYYPAGDC